MHLFAAIDVIREQAIGIQLSDETDLWSTILKQIGKNRCFDHGLAVAIEEIIHPLVEGQDDETAIAMWRETETGMADDADDEALVSDSVRMDLEMELLQEVTELAYREAKGN